MSSASDAAQRAAAAAAHALIEQGAPVKQVLVVVTLQNGDTALAPVGATEQDAGPDATLNTLLSHVKIAVQERGGDLNVLALPEQRGEQQ